MSGKNIRLNISRTIQLPDPVKLAQMTENPEFGPKVLFFSGGTALRSLCLELTGFTHNSIHVITPFDSGGSSAELRRIFRMPAVGDIRNRLMSLADQGPMMDREIIELFSYRLSKTADNSALKEQLVRMAKGENPLVFRVSGPMRKIVCEHLHSFLNHMPETFNLGGASIGNLVLTAGYLDQGRRIDPAIETFSGLLNARGIVRPVIDNDLHLAAILDNGRVMVGQHCITGKETLPLNAGIERLFLTDHADSGKAEPVSVHVRDEIRELTGQARLICYPMGSFYSSIIANLLPKGIGTAISRNECRKVYIPNTGFDPESLGLQLADQVEILLSYLRADAPGAITTSNVLNIVLIDENRGLSEEEEDRIRSSGVRIIRFPLVTSRSAPFVDGKQLAQALISLS